MAISKATKVWLDGVAEGSDHAALCACAVFAALESNGHVGGQTTNWLKSMVRQRRFPLVSTRAADVLAELERLRNAK